MPSFPTEKIQEFCSNLNCGKQLHARGFCVSCYYKKMRNGDILPQGKWRHRLSNIDIDNKVANCAFCGPYTKIISRGNNKWRCYTDVQLRSKVYKKAYRESKKHLLDSSCKICGSKDKLCWDHCHDNGLYRGTLCSSCNVGLGHFRDNIDLLYKAIDYLNDNKSN